MIAELFVNLKLLNKTLSLFLLGRCLFPATAYLYLVWETLGLMMGVFFFDVGVTFEDIKFVRATALPKNQDVEFVVMIQPGEIRIL